MTGPEAFMQSLARIMAEAYDRPCVVVKLDEPLTGPPPCGPVCSAAQAFGDDHAVSV